jgi:hypothetical protein
MIRQGTVSGHLLVLGEQERVSFQIYEPIFGAFISLASPPLSIIYIRRKHQDSSMGFWQVLRRV